MPLDAARSSRSRHAAYASVTSAMRETKGESLSLIVGGNRQVLEYHKALLCVLISTLGFALASSLVRINKTEVGRTFPVVELTLLRALGGFVVFGAMLRSHGLPYLPKDSSGSNLAFVRGLFDAVSSTCYYFACISLPIALAAIIMAVTPITSGLLARLVLDEPYHFGHFLCMLFVCFGVFIAVGDSEINQQGSSDIVSWIGMACAFSAAGFQSIQLVIGRKVMSGDMHWLHVCFISSAGTFILFVAVWFIECFRSQESFIGFPEWDKKVLALTFCTLSTILTAQALLAIGQRYAVVSTTALIRTLQLPLSMFFAAVLARQAPTRGYVCGAAVVAASCFCQVALDDRWPTGFSIAAEDALERG